MPANTAPIFTLTPNVGRATITTAAANVKSDGVGTVATDNFLAFTAGANGSFIERVRFMSVASAAATTGVATTLRVFISTVNAGGTTAANTFLLGEISVPAIASSHSTNAVAPYELALGIAIPTGTYILVSQHVAQTANQNWIATVIGGDY
jgi:hypothetical protein